MRVEWNTVRCKVERRTVTAFSRSRCKWSPDISYYRARFVEANEVSLFYFSSFFRKDTPSKTFKLIVNLLNIFVVLKSWSWNATQYVTVLLWATPGADVVSSVIDLPRFARLKWKWDRVNIFHDILPPAMETVFLFCVVPTPIIMQSNASWW